MGHALSLRHRDNTGSFAIGAATDIFALRGSDHSRTVDVALDSLSIDIQL
jgi:hypothetical protein